MCGNYSWAETIWGNTVASFSNTSFHTVLYCNTECIFNQPLSKNPGRTFSLLFWSSALHIRPFVVNCPITGILTSKVIKNNPKLSLTYKNSIWIRITKNMFAWAFNYWTKNTPPSSMWACPTAQQHSKGRASGIDHSSFIAAWFD